MNNLILKLNTKFYPVFLKGAKVMELTGKNNAQKLIAKSLNALYEIAQRSVPENDKFKKVYTSFDVPDKIYQTILYIEHDKINPKDLRRLRIGIKNKYSDRLFSCLICKGTKKELLSFIKKTNASLEVHKIFNSLLDNFEKH